MKDAEEILNKFVQRGLVCGEDIAKILQKAHPGYTVYALYRSAIAIKYGDNGIDVFVSGDPHAMGGDVNDESIAASEIHMIIVGDRWGPQFFEKRREKWVQLVVDEED